MVKYPRTQLIENFIGDYRLSLYRELDSTNAQALRFAEQGDPGKQWIMAETQINGRGRLGRKWQSQAGNLCASLLIKVDCSLQTASQLSLLAGLAAFDALQQAVEEHKNSYTLSKALCLKWPNDILLNYAKIGGILLESRAAQASQTADQHYVILGIGLNLAWHPELEARKTCALSDYDIHISPDKVLQTLAKSTQYWLEIWDMGHGFAKIRAEWLKRAQDIGTSIQVHIGNEIVYATFSGLAEDGGLMLTKQDGETVHIQTGDIFLQDELRDNTKEY
ncbi:MAG: biotin--[acetyl-CoA-carboxylase] ligase [Pseudomonadota bacterium]